MALWELCLLNIVYILPVNGVNILTFFLHVWVNFHNAGPFGQNIVQ